MPGEHRDNVVSMRLYLTIRSLILTNWCNAHRSAIYGLSAEAINRASKRLRT